jgi:hypothetical protein
MARWSTLQVLNDTSLFDSRQLQPRSVLTCGMRMWAQWMSDHMLPFPQLIRDKNFGVVVTRASVNYERPFTFFSANEFQLRGTLSVGQKRRHLQGEIHFMNGNERFIHIDITLHPLSIDPDCDFGAVPSRVEGEIFHLFHADEISSAIVARSVRKLIHTVAPESIVATAVRPVRIGRHDSEAADQWSYIELGAHAASAREDMILDCDPERRELLQDGLVAPLSAVDIEIGRPLFLFDTAEIHSTAVHDRDGLTFIHVYKSKLGGEHEHATVVERFAQPSDAR